MTVTDSDSPAVSATDTHSVGVTQVIPPLEVDITGPTSIESGTSGTWQVSASGGVPPYTYSWRYAGRCLNDGDPLTRDEPCEWQWVNAGSGSIHTRTITTPSDYARLEVTVTDSQSSPDSATDVHSVEVTQPNLPPVAEGTVANRTITLGYPSPSIGVSTWFSDPNGDPLTYTVSLSPSGIVNASISGSTLSITAVSAGTASVTVTAEDPSGADVDQSFNVTVNREPVVSNNIADQTLTAGGASATFDLDNYFSDPDGDDLTYWALSNATGVASASISDSMLMIAPVAAGSATVTVTARDPSQASATQSVGVTVSTTTGLTVSISGPSSVTSPGSTTWTASASGGSTPYTYSWRYRLCDDGGPLDRAEPVCQWVSGGAADSLSLTLSDSTTLELTVTDDAGDSATATLSVSYDL